MERIKPIEVFWPWKESTEAQSRKRSLQTRISVAKSSSAHSRIVAAELRLYSQPPRQGLGFPGEAITTYARPRFCDFTYKRASLRTQQQSLREQPRQRPQMADAVYGNDDGFRAELVSMGLSYAVVGDSLETISPKWREGYISFMNKHRQHGQTASRI
jgi:hypothetical protein